MEQALRVMVALDFGPDTAALRHRLCALQRLHPALQVELVYVLSERELQMLAGWGFASLDVLAERASSLAATSLQHEQEALKRQGVSAVRTHLLRGKVSRCLAELAAQLAADVLLAGSGNRMWRAALLGSTARGLLADYPGALWLARGDDAPEVSRIAVAIDGGGSCAAAARLAAGLFPRADRELLRVLDLPQLPEGLVDVSEVEGRRSAARVLLDDAVAAMPGTGVSASLLEGRPVAAITAHLHAQPASLLVVGRSAAGTGESRRRLGATAAGLVEAASVDLLVGPL